MMDNIAEMMGQALDALLEKASVYAYAVDSRSGELLMIGDLAARKLGKPKQRLVGACCHEIFPESHPSCTDCPVRRGQFTGKAIGYTDQFQACNPHFGGRFNVKLHQIKWYDGRDAALVLYEEASHMPQDDKAEAHSAFWNGKFMLPNALCLEKEIEAIAPETAFALICFDIIALRTINEGYGRRTGDRLMFAIRDWVASLDLGKLFHLGSDEFCLLLTGADMDMLRKAAHHIYGRFDKPWNLTRDGEDIQLYCALSMGIVSSKVIRSSEDILNVIDRVLKIASNQKEIAVYSEKIDQLLERRLEIEISLKNCVNNHMEGFEVHYQPIINSITGLWCGLEALCRWTSPSLGVVSPLEFVPIAEQQGFIGPIGEWILETGVKQCKEWNLDAHEEFYLDINLSPIQLLDENLDTKVLKILERYDYPSHKVCLEITESAQVNFDNHTLGAISRLTRQGIPIALDDFGTGYSSYDSLKHLPASVLKTERSFLVGIETDEYLQQLLETMVSLAHAAGMKMVAEGVETAGQMKILMDNRVDFVQGYLFSKPLPGEELVKKLDKFYHKEENSFAGGYSRIDINMLLHSENAYNLPPSLYRTLIRCMRILFNTPDLNDGINAVLKVIGEKLRVNRHVVFLKDPGGETFTNTHAWSDDNTESNIGQFISVNIAEATPSFIPLFEKEGMIVSADVATLPRDIYEMFRGIGVRSNIATPLWRGRELLGYVGLDVCTGRRNWLPEEVLMVHSVCGVLANVLDRVFLHDAMLLREGVLNSVLNNMEVLIYVSDPETDVILFANDAMRRHLGAAAGTVKGKTCWKTVHGCNTGRCAFCKLPQLLESPWGGPVVWEHAFEPGGGRYTVYDSIIPWENHRQAHLQYAVGGR